MDEGTLLEWMVAPGDEVKKGQVVAVIDTAKSAIDVEVFESGVVAELMIEPGTLVPVGTPLARIEAQGLGKPRRSLPRSRSLLRSRSPSRAGADACCGAELAAEPKPAAEPVPADPTSGATDQASHASVRAQARRCARLGSRWPDHPQGRPRGGR